ncbi:flagellar hook protein FlgE [Enterobacillus tribolii]|uniref:Flagellar hook protein FlgE n=1 Tax=Enterobacillus tribolii TaxID=1487935 RepID=A0A370R2X4_9GAMM|nr:flagellar hook protein FlgE [Enterobacillus tribolii]MBW7984772.1 flagellar hook protein FlgE [Enterobacillus tribolii]RDK96773.1 flagellar hook protein FlgE [Enterobacillus tribolii]
MGFSQAVSGLSAAASSLDVIGNNIANSQTVGFKSGTVAFADMFAGSKTGMGVKVASVQQNFNDGITTTTNRGLDVAISGNGFFRMQDSEGGIFYTRNGQFLKDANNYLVNAQGLQLTGYPVAGTPPAIQQGATPMPIQIPTTLLPAKASVAGSMVVNLNSSHEPPKNSPFSPTDVESYTYANSITTYDSLGNVHNMNLYFVKGPTDPVTNETTWQVYSIDSADTSTPGSYTPAGNLIFDQNGRLTNGNTPITLDMVASKGAPAQTFDLSFIGSMQQNTGKDGVVSQNQDGYQAGQMIGYQINDDGTIVGTYSNQQTQLLGQIVMANFANPNGLESMGDNVWQSTATSGQPIVGVAGASGLGSLTSGAVEASNVDLSQELVNMIVAQRNYQSNAQTIKTQDQILQTLVSLR